MKKWFLVFCLLIFFCVPVFAEYKPISKDLSKQYKLEVEKVLDNKYLSTKNEIDSIYYEARNHYYQVLKNKNLYIDFAASNYDSAIYSPVFNLLSEIINITQKYADVKDGVPATDFSGTLYDFLEPYFNENKVNTSKIDKLSKFARKKQIIIERYYNKLYQIQFF